tara:strand:+ start:391 stop:777 length:387 start_codon:yes stop_codon:yes gene_type:complete
MIALVVLSLNALPSAAPVYCSDKIQKYIEYNALFDHYAAIEQWKWKNEYTASDDAVNMLYLWEDFLRDAPFNPPHFNRTMTTIRNCVKHGLPDFLTSEILCSLEAAEQFTYHKFTELFDKYDQNILFK